jgi:hypothetical protein
MSTGLTFDERWQLWEAAGRSMTHFECQPHYGTEPEVMARWLEDPKSVPSLRAAEPGFDSWCRLVESNRARGVAVHRVRVVDVPITRYQLFAWHFADENMAAGERIWIIQRPEALKASLPVMEGNPDWWAIDGHLLVQPFDETGRVVDAHLHFDSQHVRAAQRWIERAKSVGIELGR